MTFSAYLLINGFLRKSLPSEYEQNIITLCAKFLIVSTDMIQRGDIEKLKEFPDELGIRRSIFVPSDHLFFDEELRKTCYFRNCVRSGCHEWLLQLTYKSLVPDAQHTIFGLANRNFPSKYPKRTWFNCHAKRNAFGKRVSTGYAVAIGGYVTVQRDPLIVSLKVIPEITEGTFIKIFVDFEKLELQISVISVEKLRLHTLFFKIRPGLYSLAATLIHLTRFKLIHYKQHFFSKEHQSIQDSIEVGKVTPQDDLMKYIDKNEGYQYYQYAIFSKDNHYY